MSLLNPGNGASQETELYFKTLEPYSFIERNGEIGWKKENLKRMFCKGNTATCLPSMVIGASHPVAMWKADKLSSYCQGPRGACRRYSASLAFRAPIQRRPLCIEQLHRCREDFISDKKDAEIKHPCRKSQLCGVISFYLGEFHNNSVTPPERHPSWYACTSSFQCQLVLTHM
ncbi:uncharacterized protein LOC123839428 isoform X8 [Mirounga angustirostris]|uniref:uncharacterized protein LOC123839428 isoform X8 n=1 Tax=Mirounga angustirostris TaxID=9716 RepID=UPI00313C5B8A